MPAMANDDYRKLLIETGQPQADLAANTEQTWDTDQLRADFEVIGFAAPFVVVRRKADGKKGTLEFVPGEHPRLYFGWVEE